MDVVQRPPGQRHLADVPGLPGREALLAARLGPPPSGVPQPLLDLGGARVVERGLHVPQPVRRRIGDGRLHRVGAPPPGDDGRPHPDREGALAPQVRDQRRQPPLGQVGRVPVDERALREIRQVLLQAGQRAVEHEARAQQPSLLVEPAQALRRPVRLHLAPGGDLGVAGGPAGRDERQVLVAGEGPEEEGHGGSCRGPDGTAGRGACRTGGGGVPPSVSLGAPGVPLISCASVRARTARHPCSSASARTSARCRPRRPASCSSWVRQEYPSARTTASSPASRTAGSSCSSAQATDTS